MSIHNMKVAGIDTGKSELHVCLLPQDKEMRFSNDETGIALLVEALQAAGVVRCGIEATSIYHRKAVRAVAAAGIEVAELQPRQVKAFAVAVLQWSKSDRLDARTIARFTQILETVRQPASEVTQQRAEILTYIEQLEDRIAQLKNTRGGFTDPRLLKTIAADIKRLRGRRKRELARLETRLRQSPAESLRLDLLISIGGVGQRTALGLLIRMPELGHLGRGQAASLVGLAPHLHESGKFKGERHIYGGRARLRQTIFMAAFAASAHWNADLKVFYRRLVANGKAHTAAIVACARKLIIIANAVLARGTPWQDRRVTP